MLHELNVRNINLDEIEQCRELNSFEKAQMKKEKTNKFELSDESKEKLAKFKNTLEEEKKTDSKVRVEAKAAKTNQKRGRGRGAM